MPESRGLRNPIGFEGAPDLRLFQDE